jgi:glycosyltransferase 2 family protein
MIWLGLGVGLIAFVAITLLSDVNQLLKYARDFPWWVMLPVLLLRGVNWLIRAGKWYFLLWIVGVRNLSIRDELSTFLASLSLAATPGKVAEFLKCFIIKNMTGTPVPVTVPTIIAERTTDGMAVVLWLVVSIAAVANPTFLPIALFSIATNIAVLIVLMIRPLCLWALGILHRLPIIGRYADIFRTIYESSYVIYKPRNWAFAVATGLVSTTMDGIGMFVILVALGKPATPETFWYGMMATCLAVVIGSLSGSPGGAGASELTMGGVLVSQMGMSPGEAGFATILARFVQSWWGVLFGLGVAFLDRKRLFPPSLDKIIAEEEQAGRGTKSVPAVLAD